VDQGDEQSTSVPTGVHTADSAETAAMVPGNTSNTGDDGAATAPAPQVHGTPASPDELDDELDIAREGQKTLPLSATDTLAPDEAVEQDQQADAADPTEEQGDASTESEAAPELGASETSETPETSGATAPDTASASEEPSLTEAIAASESAESASPSMPEPETPVAEQSEDADASTESKAPMRLGEPLAAGAMVGPYLIERVLRVTPDEHSYLAIGIREDGERGPYVTLVERAEGGFSDNVLRLIAMRLRHPRLLAPRTLFSLEGRDYLVVETLVDEDGEPAQLVSQGGRLPIVNALTAGAGLADTLSYLHRNGVVHLHVSPDTIAVFNGRAYLTGMEQASYLDLTTADSASLTARDTNFLARTLAIIGDVPPEEVPGEDLVQDNLRRIAAHGASDGFESPGELAGACSVALESVAHALPNLTSGVAAPVMLETATATTVGRVRSQNQDASAYATFDITDDWTQGEPVGVFLVADGMGGEARGELASRIAARTVLAEMAAHFALPALILPARDLDDSAESRRNSARADTGDENDSNNGEVSNRQQNDAQQQEASELTKALVQAVERANQQVRELAQQLGKVTGTTLTAIAVQGQRASLAHLGDSRAYLLRGDVMVKLTEDHSVLARLQALDHPLLSDPDMFIPRNTLYRSLGQEEETIPDTLEFTLAPGDRLLLCSDGLWDELDSQTLAQTLAGAKDPRDCTEQLVRMANAAGGSDNSTAVAVFVHPVLDDADRPSVADIADAWNPPGMAGEDDGQ